MSMRFGLSVTETTRMRKKDLTDFTDEQINEWCEQVITKFNSTDVKRIIDRLNYRRDYIIEYYRKNEY